MEIIVDLQIGKLLIFTGDLEHIMQLFGLAAIDEFLDDYLVYRNLVPVDPRLPTLDDFYKEIGLSSNRIPRKSEMDYAKALVFLLRQARIFDAPGVAIKRVIFIGDTTQNDGTAFANICRVGKWPGYAFIGSENQSPARTEMLSVESDISLYLANRWAALADFDRFCAENSFPINEETAIVVDLDKTALGARGRNALVIDHARVQAVKNTVADLLGDNFDETAFKVVYNALNDVEFHPFTTDNQDYLAYICLILGSGLCEPEVIIADIRAGKLTTFGQFIGQVDRQAKNLPPALEDIHRNIFACVQAGDPTPFKLFRRNEYQTTINLMGHLKDDASVAALLTDEILITQEVRALAMTWKSQGALIFGSSDKPDEASIPTPELAALGYAPIHRTKSHAVGQRLFL